VTGKKDFLFKSKIFPSSIDIDNQGSFHYNMQEAGVINKRRT
jgi:hypothetical protein